MQRVTDRFRCSIEQADNLLVAAEMDGLTMSTVQSFLDWSLVYDNYRVFSLDWPSECRLRVWNRLCDLAEKLRII